MESESILQVKENRQYPSKKTPKQNIIHYQYRVSVTDKKKFVPFTEVFLKIERVELVHGVTGITGVYPLRDSGQTGVKTHYRIRSSLTEKSVSIYFFHDKFQTALRIPFQIFPSRQRRWNGRTFSTGRIPIRFAYKKILALWLSFFILDDSIGIHWNIECLSHPETFQSFYLWNSSSFLCRIKYPLNSVFQFPIYMGFPKKLPWAR